MKGKAQKVRGKAVEKVGKAQESCGRRSAGPARSSSAQASTQRASEIAETAILAARKAGKAVEKAGRSSRSRPPVTLRLACAMIGRVGERRSASRKPAARKAEAIPVHTNASACGPRVDRIASTILAPRVRVGDGGFDQGLADPAPPPRPRHEQARDRPHGRVVQPRQDARAIESRVLLALATAHQPIGSPSA